MSWPTLGFAQAASPPVAQRESTEDFTARLTPEQKQRFDQAMQAFSAQSYSDALAICKEMLKQLQGDAILSKFASEAALNSGDAQFAVSTLKPITSGDGDDWQAAALLTRAWPSWGMRIVAIQGWRTWSSCIVEV